MGVPGSERGGRSPTLAFTVGSALRSAACSLSVALLLTSQALAQTQEWLTFTSQQAGVDLHWVSAFAFDAQGRAWIAGTGLIVFDGTTWLGSAELGFPPPPPSDGTNDLCFDQAGNLWVAGWLGLFRFDGREWQWYDLRNSPLPHTDVTCLQAFGRASLGGGTLWIGTRGGLAQIVNGQWSVYTTKNAELPGDWITSLHIRPNREVWAGVFGHGVVRYEGGRQFTNYNLPAGGPYPYNTAGDMTSDGRGNLWIATSEGLVRFDGSHWHIFTVFNSPLPDNHIEVVEVDGEGTVWAGTGYAGLVKYDGQHWTVYDSTNSPLPGNTITALAIDRWGNKWMGLHDKGVAIFREGGVLLSVPEAHRGLPPYQFTLRQNYPNPFNSSTSIEFGLPCRAAVRLEVADAMGRVLASLVEGTLEAGAHAVHWDGRDQGGVPVPAGVYFCRLWSGQQVGTIKMTTVR